MIKNLITKKPTIKMQNGIYSSEVTETTDKDGRWARKCRKADNTTGYILLRGKVVFDDVIFGYNENKRLYLIILIYGLNQDRR